MDDLLLGMDAKENVFLRQSLLTPGEDAMTIVEITTKDLEYFINLVDKAVASHAPEKLFMNKSMDAANFIIVLF